jgi:internalin A
MAEQQAVLDLIDQAAREGWTELDLSDRSLSELPQALSQLTALETLDLSDNQLTTLPEWLGQLITLRKLKLNDNQLTTLPEWLGQLSNLQSLNLSTNQLTTLPEWLGQLTNLQMLVLNHNQLTTLPDMLDQLTNLQMLVLNDNQLTTLPEWLGQLTTLKLLYVNNTQLTILPEWLGQLSTLEVLNLSNNQLTTLPDTLGQLSTLDTLFASSTQLTTLPDALGQLSNLQTLYLNFNQLTTLPDALGQLSNLQALSLYNNQLRALPFSLGSLEQLAKLDLDDNPLDPVLQTMHAAGVDTLKAYLRSMDDPAQRATLFEAKLVLVGEGGVGKTTLLKALTGQGPRAGELSTHGVKIDIQALRLRHPERTDVDIQLNAWDFGGQEVYRVTHQFFFSQHAVYLLVWEPRIGVTQSQVEEWLKLIQLRVGDAARVIIVSTHCKTGERIARIDKPVLLRDFGAMIAGFLEIDSMVDDPATGQKVGIAELQAMIAEVAKDLDHMGMAINRDWLAARDQLLAIAQPRVSYAQFGAVCARHGLDAAATKALAHLMHDLGYIVYYGDDEHLKDDVVLQPEWLTKAIGFVLEDRATQALDGILPDDRLKDVWLDHPFKNEPRYGPELYPFFLRLMEKFDVSYRLESGNASLVAQHVPQVRPPLPWEPEDAPVPGQRRSALVCVMDEAPAGLVPWMIVRTHEYACERSSDDGTDHRLHWQKGMFLRNKRAGEAILELRDREFHVHAQAVWPEYFMNVLQQTLQTLITDTWPGLKDRYAFTVPCPAQPNGKDCTGRFRIDVLREDLNDGNETIRCNICRTRQNIVELLYGFENEDAREQLARVEQKLDQGFADIKHEFAELESRLANYVMTLLQAIASESKDGPRLFMLAPEDGNWHRPFQQRYRLYVWCEAEGCQHPVAEPDRGVYTFDATREWVQRVAPYANFIAGVLKTLLPMIAPALNVYFGANTVENWKIKDGLDLAKEGTDKLLRDIETSDPARVRQGVLSEAERSGVLALHAQLRELDPYHAQLGLKRVPTYTGDYLWLCQTHYEQSQPKIPEKIV